MLDHEPETDDSPSTPATDPSPVVETPPAPRRRRAATRLAGPPQVSEQAPAMTAESPPADSQTPDRSSTDQAVTDGGDGQAVPAKRATRKRTSKTAGDGAKAPRKRASKKAAAAEPDAVEPSAEESVDDSAVTAEIPSAPAEAALDELRIALSAEAPPAAPTADPAASPEQAASEETAAGAEPESPESGSPESGSGSEESEDDSESEDETEDEDDTEDEIDPGAETGAADTDGEGDGSSRRRRRRRGGRRRRRGAGGDPEGRPDGAVEQQEQESADSVAADQTSARDASAEDPGNAPPDGTGSADGPADGEVTGDRSPGDQASDDGDEAGGQRRRRRRRRRRGEDSAPSADDPAEVVVRVREPRSRQKAAEEVTGIQGSTRMEAKRQRRREGREAGRRRAPILSEAEFLARRESVVRKMVVRQRDDLSQIAVLENDILVEHYVDRESAASLIGNVYLGRVQNVLPSMEAAFIDIGRGRNAVLYAGEVDWDAFGANGQQRKVENVLKSGQTVLVQVTKDPVGAKGARLTSHVTLPGRYIVYAPGGHLSGISRKLPDNERKRLKSVLNDLVPESASVIVRTAAEGASEDELVRDVNRLKAQWEDIERKVKAGGAPKLLYGEPDLTVRIVRDLFTEDFAELIIQGNGSATDAFDAVDGYVEHVAPHLHDRMRRWDAEAEGDLFATFRLDEQIAKALERKVFLPSGGSLIIDRSEAMTVIDVNTGKFTGSGGNLEATVTSNNLEAAEEIVRQLRLRDVGGIIVIDFIDMVLPSNRELLLRRLVECLGRDRTRHQVAEVTSLGLVQMTRKKIGTGLLEAFSTECEHCHGRGYQISDVPVESQKQPDGGSRDHRGGGRGRGRGNGPGSGSNGTTRSAPPMPIPAALRPETGTDGPSESQVESQPESQTAPAG